MVQIQYLTSSKLASNKTQAMEQHELLGVCHHADVEILLASQHGSLEGVASSKKHQFPLKVSIELQRDKANV